MMDQSALQAEIEAANAYEALFVPALFAQWAPKLIDACKIGSGQRVLDVACGTGALTREVAARVSTDGHVTGLDVNRGMLSIAERIAPAIEWREGRAESLPFADASFDAVVSQFGLMFFKDRSRALQEMTRVLTPDGRLAVAVWGSLSDMPAFATEVVLVERIAGQRAADPLRAPFALGDAAVLAQIVHDAGLESATVSTHRGTARFPSIRAMVEADLRGWLPLMGVILSEEMILDILEQAEQELGRYVGADGLVEFELSVHIATAINEHH
jgi:SAM-dependent methyltransferase